VARVVILSFNDNDAAEHFIESVWTVQDGEVSSEQLQTETMAAGAIAAACSKIEAMVARPTIACKCKILSKRAKQWRRSNQSKFAVYDGTSGWYRTERFGWFVHRPCNKPNRFVVSRFIKNMVIGAGCKDLLPELDERLYPEPEESIEDREERLAEERTPEELEAIREETNPERWTENVITSL
jgi:hypothetical protein